MSEDQIRVGDAPTFDGPPAPPPSASANPPAVAAYPQGAPAVEPRIDLFDPPTDDELAGKSPLQQLEESLGEPAEEVELTKLRVPRRKGVELLFDSSKINSTNRKAWQKRATKRSRRAGVEPEVDDFLFACLILANTHVGTLSNGREARDSEGTPLTFAHAQLWAMVKARDPQECIEKLFANDQHVSVASGEVLLAAGFDDDLAADPTAG